MLAVFGSGLPDAPVVALSAAPDTASAPVLVAATYGRGLWQTALWSAGTGITSASAIPASLTFPSQAFDTTSIAQTVTLENTGSIALTPTSISIGAGFGETDNCVNASIAAGASCSIQVTFTPQATGPLTGEMIVYANVYGGQLTVDLSGTGAAAGVVTLTPSSVSFGQVEDGATSASLQITVANSSASAIPIASVSITAPFVISSNACGTSSLAASSDCEVNVEFKPTQAGAAAGLLTFTDGAGTQTVELTGTGAAPPTDILNPASLTFPSTGVGQVSAALSVTITNIGDLPLTFPANPVTVSGEFQLSGAIPTEIPAHAVGAIGVVFAPTQLGALTGTLTITDALQKQTVALSGTGVALGALSVTPTSLTFTNQQPGVASTPQTLTISNNGASAVANVGFQFSGAAASSYSVPTTTCGALLNNGNSCTAQIVFTPSATGAIAATLVVSSSTTGVGSVSVPINGSGQLTAGLTTNPAQLTFPVISAGLVQHGTVGHRHQLIQLRHRLGFVGGSHAVQHHAKHLYRQSGSRRQLRRSGRISAQRGRRRIWRVDGQLLCRRHVGNRGAFGNRLRFHSRLQRSHQPDRDQRPASQLHAGNFAGRVQWHIQLRMRNVAVERALPLQPRQRNAQRRRRGQCRGRNLHRQRVDGPP